MKKNYTRLLFLIALTLICVLPAFTSHAQFITEWQTTTANESITIPTTGGGYNYSVDWGDGSPISTGQAGDAMHTYTIAGTYTVSITGTFPRIYFFYTAESADKIIGISQWGTNAWTSMNYAFTECHNLNITATDTPVLAGVTDMSYMFASCKKLNPTGAAATALSKWHTDAVTSMAYMFWETEAFNQDIDDWNTANVTDMSNMFYDAIVFNQDIGNWNTANVTDMSWMFWGAAAFNKNIGDWNTANVTNMSHMFIEATTFNQNIGNWNTANVESMADMFYEAVAFNQDIGNWNTANVTDMSGMFWLAAAFNQNISNWNTSKVTGMSEMFYGARAFNQDIGNWNTAKVMNMGFMFSGATAFNQDLGNWNIDVVYVMAAMLDNSGLSITNYDSTLIGWARQVPLTYVALGADDLNYCAGADARNTLITTYNWQISGDALSCALPLELISFTVQKSGTNAVQINWVSGVESGIATESLQRSSDAENWETIYTQLPKGSNSHYVAYDESPVAGNNYYRLLTTDMDGNKKYSPVRSINFSNSLLPKIFPNPTTGALWISNIKIGDVILLTDVSGRQLLKQLATNETQMLNFNSLVQGIYFISIIRNSKIVINDKITKLN